MPYVGFGWGLETDGVVGPGDDVSGVGAGAGSSIGGIVGAGVRGPTSAGGGSRGGAAGGGSSGSGSSAGGGSGSVPGSVPGSVAVGGTNSSADAESRGEPSPSSIASATAVVAAPQATDLVISKAGRYRSMARAAYPPKPAAHAHSASNEYCSHLRLRPRRSMALWPICSGRILVITAAYGAGGRAKSSPLSPVRGATVPCGFAQGATDKLMTMTMGNIE